MNKIIYIFLVLCLLISSCGKKGDPIYKQNEQKTEGTKLKVVL
tara:strand:- start:130 stop:258 length:129 start_codon:yes stop_codon:yes gene_type:complete